MYIGMTIGPIVDTLMSTSTPAGLWAASYMFSEYSFQLCKSIEKAFGSQPSYQMMTPYFGEERISPEGIGSYPDRIIFSVGDVDEIEATLQKSIDDVGRTIASQIIQAMSLDKGIEAITSYFNIQYVIVEEEAIEGSVIAYLSPILDAIELDRKHSATEGKALLNQFFKGSSSSQNHYLRNYVEQLGELKNIQLYHPVQNRMLSLDDIAKGKSKSNLKRHNYIAIVQADGDGFGKLICQLEDPIEIEAFSKFCMDFSQAAAQKIKDWGAMTIYAGGDDLLFIAPVSSDAGHVVTLCQEIDQLLQDYVKKLEHGDLKVRMLVISDSNQNPKLPLSMSFGIQMAYYKFPLYEAFSQAASLLFGRAKYTDGKNCMAINLLKHSGQSVELTIKNHSSIYERCKELLSGDATSDEMIHAILYHLESKRFLFEKALLEDRVEDFFFNVFDDYVKWDDEGKRAFSSAYVESIYMLTQSVIAFYENEKPTKGVGDIVSNVTSILRFVKFNFEGGEQ